MKAETLQFKIVPANQAKPEALAAFYDKYFAERRFPLKHNWEWQNRVVYSENKTPLVMLDGDRVIAHAGIIPFKLRRKDIDHNASWYIDFMVDEDYRRRGLGLQITNAFTQLSEIYYAVTGNEKSMGAFRKLGWAESEDSFIHYIPLRPFNHPKFATKLPGFIRQILNLLSYPFIFLNSLKFKKTKSLQVGPVTETLLDALETTDFTTDRWTPVRNLDYWRWRLSESPDADSYHYFKIEGKYLLFKTELVASIKTLEVLFLPSKLPEVDKLSLIGSLSFWALSQGYSYVRLYTTIPSFSNQLRSTLKSFITRPEFAFKATDPVLFQQLKDQPNWDFQFIDNDFETL